MEQKNKFCNKKRSIANRVFSLILVFAMVISNVQTAPGMISTVWAAENETAESGETAERSEASEDEERTGQTGEDSGGDEKTETVDKESETDTASNEEESVRSEETTETESVSKPNDEEDETEVTETTESVTESTEVSESTDTDETEETTEEVKVDVGESDDTLDAEQVNVVIHFRNSLGWSEVAAHFGKHNGTGWDGDALSGGWPGITGDDLQKDENGYYTVSREVPKSSGFVIIFNNNNKNEQTQNIVIPSSDFTDVNTYERWVWIEGEMTETDEGNQYTRKNAVISSVPVVSPEIKDDGTVTFRYKNDSATTVVVAGTMNGWTTNTASENYWEMEKGEDSVFTYTTKTALVSDDYKYKFVVDGDWLRDPNNESFETSGDGNSLFTIEGDNPSDNTSPEVEGNSVTFRYKDTKGAATVLLAGTMNGWNGDPKTDNCIKMTKDETTGIFTHTMDLDHGEYQYKFVLFKEDGTLIDWIIDPWNDLKITEDGGNQNSVVYVAGDKTYNYTIHYYNSEYPNANVTDPDLYVWENGTLTTGKLYSFEGDKLQDTDNNIEWLTTTIEVPFTNLGLVGKPVAGDTEAGWKVKDTDKKYRLKSGESAELWYVYGSGVYDKKPMLGAIEKVEASLQLDSMNYTQNNVLSLTINDGEPAIVNEAYVDASALGMSNKMVIDTELLAISLSVKEDIPAGTYTLPVTVVGYDMEEVATSVDVTVVEYNKGENDFDWDEAVIYFMVTDRFFDGNNSNNGANGTDGEYNTAGDNAGLYHGGDFAGVTAKLDYLKELGVNTIWITPIVENVKGVTVEGQDSITGVPYYAAYHGYWASDFTKLNPALGTDKEFETLIETAHNKDMKIMVDVVVNHAGYGMEAEETFAGMLRDSKEVVETDHELGGYQAGLPDFLTELPEVRNKIIEWQVDWAKKGVDYFRVDTVQHVDSATWMAFKNALTEANPKFKMIGEYFGAGYNSANGGRLGSGQMDSLLDFNFNEWATDFVSGKISQVENNLAGRNKALNNTYLTGQFLSSHDEDGFKQNLKNNGWTENAAAAASYVAATLQITAKGQPVIYYGEEIGLSGNNDYPYQTNRYDFKWDELEQQQSQEGSIYNHYKKMLAIRNEYSEVFAKGDRQVVDQSNTEKYDIISRSYNGTTLYVGMNINTDAEKTVTFNVNSKGIKAYKDLYSEQIYTVAENGTIEVTIPAAIDGGTVVLVADSFAEGLIAPELTAIAKGKVTALPKQLTRMSASGEETLVDVAYSMETAEGVTLDNVNKKITVAETFAGVSVKLTATAGSDTVEFELKVVEDKNEITVRLHYHRPDGDYENWNIWTWGSGTSAVVQFTSEDEAGGKVAEVKLEGRTTGVMNYIIRKSTPGNEWAEKDFPDDCYIDLSEVLSGTVDYYVESGQFPGKRVLGDDVLIGVKLLSVTYNSQKNTIKVITGTPIAGSLDDIFTLKRSDGTEIAITGVTLVSKEENEYEVSIGADLSGMEEITKKYSLFYDEYEYKVTMPSLYSSKEFEDAYTYEGNDLGAVWSKEKTTFKVWAPTADKVQVKLYKSGTEKTDDLIETLDMTKGDKGVWTAEKEGDINGTYYTYNVTVDGSTAEACDPYAKTTGVNGNRAMVIDMDATDPSGWADDRGPNQGMSYTDSVIYELHVRDFSIDESSGISDKNKGKFLGLTETGTKNATGQTTGLDYLTDLGVTHIHLLPSYDYATVDETKLNEAQYNWGYDPKNYNVPEGSYSTDPYNGDVRVKEMKQMIKTLHDNNINVIMDVVYNHVYDADKFCFNQLVPKYFSRTNADGTYSSGSGCGNDTASERSMVKKYIVDSVNYWADEYHIDGFRFDLVGLLDTETINEVVDTVHEKHPDAVFYGEGWTMETAVSKEGYTMATQANSVETPQFAFFSDTIRDTIKGDNFNAANTGFVSGKTGLEEMIAKCFMAVPDWCKSPIQTVNYASCHDNYTLWDKISVSRKDASQEDRIKMNNLSAAIYMMSEGIPLIHAAEEILRTKVDENGEVIHNSYNSSDYVNSIKWADLDKEEYRAVRDYYKGLIAFRKNHSALRLTSAEDVSQNVKYNWIANEVVMFTINGKDKIASEISDGIIVIFNATTSEKEVDLYDGYGVAEGTWNICIDDQKAGIETLASVTDGKVKVAPISAMVLVKGEAKDSESVYDKNEQQKIENLLKELNALIAQYEKEEQGERTDESWAVFKEALEAAKTTAGKTDVTLSELNLAKSNLQAAHDALTTPEGVVDKEKLKALVATYREIINDGQGSYTDESWNAFLEAMTEAESVLTNSDATQIEVDEAYDKLESSNKKLISTKNTEKLDALIEEYSRLEKGDYTDESWETFVDVLNAAKAIADKPNATQTEIDKAVQDLKTAYDDLKVPEGMVDKGKLKALITVCKETLNKGQGSYTDESWNAFTSALTEAEAVLENSDVTQAEIDDAKSKLDKAHNNLFSTEKELKALKELIAECEKKEKDDYTDESWKVFEYALNSAKAVAENQNATLDEIQNAIDDLQNAADKLTKVLDGLWTKWADDSGLTLGSDGKYHTPYTGKALKPAILVYDGRTLLKEKTDYTITYRNNTNAGTEPATVTIKGKGNYTESHVEEFFIDAIDIGTLDIADLYTAVAQNNTKQIAPKPVVKFNGKTLKLNKDYTVAYENPDTDGKSLDGKAIAAFNVIVAAKSSNFTGSKTIHMTLVDKSSVNLMSKAKIGKIAAQQYEKDDATGRGKILEPEVTVKYGKNTLSKQTNADDPNSGDYTVIYDAEHTEAGETATITVRGNGTTYVGEKTISFKITGTALKAGDITLENATGITYTGTEQKPVVAIKNMDTKDVERCATVSYQNNTNVGTATVVITGRNGYTGTVKKTFKIAAYDISAKEDNKFTYNQNVDGSMSSIVTYAKGGSKLTDEQVGASFLVTAESSVRLEQGKDFTLSYKNNKKVGEKTASVTIKGKGNFKGTIKDIPFTIEARSLKDLEEDALAGDILKKNAKKYNKVIPVIMDQDGKALKNKTDFVIDVESAYTYEDGSAITETPKVGDVIRVTAKAKQGGNYTGELSATFRVIDDNMSLAKATVKVAPQQYTGAEVKPGKDQITVEMKINGSKETLQDGDYEIIGHSNNIKKGTAKLTIHGLGKYGGTKTVSFKINAQPMK